MVIQRKGRATKLQKIQTAIKNAHDIEDVYRILDEQKFNLSNEEAYKIAQTWHKEQVILRAHGKGAYATPEQVVV